MFKYREALTIFSLQFENVVIVSPGRSCLNILIRLKQRKIYCCWICQQIESRYIQLFDHILWELVLLFGVNEGEIVKSYVIESSATKGVKT